MPTIISETEMPVPTPTPFLMQGVCFDMDDVVKKPDGSEPKRLFPCPWKVCCVNLYDENYKIVASQEIKKEKDLHGQRV